MPAGMSHSDLEFAVADLAFVALTCAGFLLLALLARGVSKP